MREIDYKVDVDIIRKIENDYRVPTKKQLKKYAALHALKLAVKRIKEENKQ